MQFAMTANFLGYYYTEFQYLCKLRALMIKLPGFFFSSYPATGLISPIVVSMDQFQKLTSRIYEMKRDGLLFMGYSEEYANQKIDDLPQSL